MVWYNKSMKKINLSRFKAAGVALAATVASFAMSAVPAAHAAYFNAGKNVTVESTATVAQNVYVAGASVAISSPVNGDVLAAGSTLYISSKATGDIMAIGSNVTIQGASAQDVRVAAANLTVGGAFSGELAAAGASVTVTPGTTIAKDSYIAGANISFDGSESGSLYLAGSAVYFDGTTGGNLVIKNAKQVTIGPDAVIGGSFDYTAQAPATIDQGSHIAGATTFHQAAVKQASNDWIAPFAALITLWWFIKFLMMLTAAYLFWYVLRRDAAEVTARATHGFWKELLRGFVIAVALPIAAIIALITVIGVIPGIAALLSYGLMLLVACPVAGVVTAAIIWHKRQSNLAWYHILLGVLILDVVGLVPFIGWIVALAVYLASFGALVMVLWLRIVKKA